VDYAPGPASSAAATMLRRTLYAPGTNTIFADEIVSCPIVESETVVKALGVKKMWPPKVTGRRAGTSTT